MQLSMELNRFWPRCKLYDIILSKRGVFLNNYVNQNDQNEPSLFYRQYLERRSIKSMGNIIGSAVFIFLFVSSLLTFFSSLSIKILAKTFIWNSININNSTVENLLSGICSIIALMIAFLFVKFMSNTSFGDIIPLKKLGRKALVAFVFLGVSVSVYANFIADKISLVFKFFGIRSSEFKHYYQDDTFNIFVNILVVAIIPAIFEEVLFRGAILGVLKKYGDWFAILTSSLVFALVHINTLQIPFCFILGLILGFSVIKTGSIIPAILIHFFNNLYSVWFDIISNTIDESKLLLIYVWFTLFLVLGGISALLYLLLKDKKLFSLSSSNSALKLGSKVSSFIGSIGIALLIVFVCFYVLFS